VRIARRAVPKVRPKHFVELAYQLFVGIEDVRPVDDNGLADIAGKAPIRLRSPRWRPRSSAD
jgi:hypothetical protein